MFHRDNDVRYGLPLKLTLALAALVIIIGGMKFAASLLVPLLLAIFVAVVCTAPIQWLHRMGLGLRTSVWLILGLIGGFLSLIGLLLVNSFSTFVEALPGIEDTLQDFYIEMLDGLARMGLAIEPNRLARLLDVEEFGSWVPGLLGELEIGRASCRG